MKSPVTVTFEGGAGCGPAASGLALVSTDHFGVRYDLDPESGVITNRSHQLYGESIAGWVLVFDRPKGGVAASWALADLVERGIAPAAIVFRQASPIFVQGCIFAGLTLLQGLSPNPCTTLESGDRCELLPSEGRLVAHRDGQG